jgi:ribosomal protein S19
MGTGREEVKERVGQRATSVLPKMMGATTAMANGRTVAGVKEQKEGAGQNKRERAKSGLPPWK